MRVNRTQPRWIQRDFQNVSEGSELFQKVVTGTRFSGKIGGNNQMAADGSSDAKLPSDKGRRLRLRFVSDAYPELKTVEFNYGDGCETVVLDQDSSKTEQSFRWTPVPRAFSILFLEYLSSKASYKSYVFRDPKPVRSLGYDRYKQGFLGKVFAWAGKNRARTPQTGKALKVEHQRGTSRPQAIRINWEFLDPACIEVSWDRGKSGFERIIEFDELTKKIRESVLGLPDEEERQDSPQQPIRQSNAADKQVPAVVKTQGQEHVAATSNDVVRAKHNLPEAPARFFGHAELREAVVRKISGRGLTVLHEIGGMGKTTFANQVAHDAVNKGMVPGGAVWLNMELSPSVEECQRAIAGVLFRTSFDHPNSKCAKLLDEYFARHHTLLLFDNFETVVSNEEHNRLLRDYSQRACVLATTREIRHNLRPHVETLHKLAPEDALRLFLYEAGLTRVSEEDAGIIMNLCAMLGYVPLAIVLLARQAPKTVLPQLALELQRNLDFLTTDDASFDKRHWSIAACFMASFGSLSAEDRDTLFRLSVVPHGLPKRFIAEYLNKPDWLQSVGNCLSRAFFQLENDRYVLQPLVKTLVYRQMGSQKEEWAWLFMHFFCGLLGEVMRSGSPSTHEGLLLGELENCRAALKKVVVLRSQQHAILAMEYVAEQIIWSYPNYFPAPIKEWENDRAWLETTLAGAEGEQDSELRERSLVVQFECCFRRPGDTAKKRKILGRLARLNPLRAKAMRHALVANNCADKGQFKKAYQALIKARDAWAKIEDRFPGEFAACCYNIFNIGRSLKEAKVVVAASRTLKQIGFRSAIYDPGGFRWGLRLGMLDGTRRLRFLTESPSDSLTSSIVGTIGEALFDLRQWAEAEPWLLRNVVMRDVQYNDESEGPTIELPMLLLAETWLQLGRIGEAERAYGEIAEVADRDHLPCYLSQWMRVRAKANLGLATILAMRKDYNGAVKRACSALRACKYGDCDPERAKTKNLLIKLKKLGGNGRA